MIDHTISQFKLTEDYKGEQVQPSEQGNLHIPSTLRQFLIQCRRNYSFDVLDNLEYTEGLNITYHNSDSISNFVYNELPYFHLQLTAQPDSNLNQFIQEQGNDFVELLLELTGKSHVPTIRGNRPAFVGEFEKEYAHGIGDVFVSHILIGTAIFYNDYRITTNFPSSDQETDQVVGYIYNAILSQYPTLKLELVPTILK